MPKNQNISKFQSGALAFTCWILVNNQCKTKQFPFKVAEDGIIIVVHYTIILLYCRVCGKPVPLANTESHNFI